MKILHCPLMGALTLGLLAVAAGFLTTADHTAIAQHGHGAQAETQAEAQAHFDNLVKELELTTEQRAAIAPSFGRAFALMQELHGLHETMAAEMTEAQRAKFEAMMRHALGGATSEAHPHGAAQH